MRRFMLIPVLALITLFSFGQINPVDFEGIKAIAVSDQYNDLLNRYKANDTTLTLNDYRVIYYGQIYKDDYKPYKRHDSIKALDNYLNKSSDVIDFHKVLQYTHQILSEYPFNIEQIFITAVVYDKSGENELSHLWFYKYDKLIRTILSSGDGKTETTAFIVTKVTDEYSILDALGLNASGQILTSKNNKYYDLINITQNDQKIDKLFFDVSHFFGKWK